MRILHVLDHSIPLQSGYTFRTLSILKEQRALGWETIQLTSPRHTRPYIAEERVDGWTFWRTPAPNGALSSWPVLREIAEMRATTSRLAEIVAATRPDIIHAHSPVLNAIPALRLGRRLKIPVVYEVRAFWEDAAASHGTNHAWGPRYLATRMVETRALKRADAVTTICDGLRRDILARGVAEAKVTVIPNAVDLAEFPLIAERDQTLAEELGLAQASVVGFIGSFYAYEGLDQLLAAVPQLIAARPEIRVLLVGGGPEEHALKAQAASLHLGNKVIFTGRVPHSEVQRYYSLVDVFIYPRVPIRLTELVTPLKPLEAMAQGKIVIASNVGGHRELIRDGETGTLFAAGSVDDLARAVIQVIGRRAIWPRQRTLARKFVETERSWPQSVARYRPVYDRLLARRT